MRVRCHWAEQSLRVPSPDLAWAHVFVLVGKKGLSMTLVEGISNIFLGLTFFKLMAERKEALQQAEPTLVLTDVRGS